MGTRDNILSSPVRRDQFLRGCRLLSEMGSGVMASTASRYLRDNIPGASLTGREQELSYYDLMVFWHSASMSISMPPGNAAHSAPSFLPWHRMYLRTLERWIQIVVGDDDFGLPYWDWAADGELPVASQWNSQLWTSDYLGESRNSVRSGEVGRMRKHLRASGGRIFSIDGERINRDAGRDPGNRRLPRQAHVSAALNETQYDEPGWGQNAAGGHRNRLEGWIGGPQLHNLVHVWIGGDMGPGTSPNDPVFFLNHCNVDRIWEAWMAQHGREYNVPTHVAGHREDDRMYALLGESLRPSDVLDPSQWYSYDSLTVD